MFIKKVISCLLVFSFSFYVSAQDELLDQTLGKGSIDAELEDLENSSGTKVEVTESKDFDQLDLLEKEVASETPKRPNDIFAEDEPIKKLPKKTVKKEEVIEDEIEEDVEDEVGEDTEVADESNMEDLADTRYEKRIATFYRGKKRMTDNEWKERIGQSFEEVYVVLSGDTLWAISGKFLDSPWYWPKIWELNSYITNPHLIEPGQEIRFKFSAQEGPSITLIPSNTNSEIRQEQNSTDYSVLEQEAQISLFDRTGFLKEGLKSLNLNPSSTTNIGGGEFYFDNDPDFLGEIYAGNSEKSFFEIGDEIELKLDIACTPGKVLSVMSKVRSSIFSLNGDVKMLRDSSNKMCRARVEKNYAPIEREMRLVEQIAIPVTDSINDDRVITGRIVELSPSNNSIHRKRAAEGDRVFVRFAESETQPTPGTLIYLYEIKDPHSGKEIDPHVVGIAKLIHLSGNYATADVITSSRTLGTDTSVTTRF